MNGKRESIKDTLTRLESETNEILARKGVFRITVPACEAYLSISGDELRTMPLEELYEMAFDLRQYAYYLQTYINDLESRINLCKWHVRELVGYKVGKYPGVGDERWYAAIHDNPLAQRWARVEMKTQLVLDRMAYLPLTLHRYAESVQVVINSKRSMWRN